MLFGELCAKRDDILALANKYGARRIRVFGSVARGEERKRSDIDFLVDFPQDYDLFGQRLPLARKLSELTGKKVDVVPEHKLNKHIRAAILEEAIKAMMMRHDNGDQGNAVDVVPPKKTDGKERDWTLDAEYIQHNMEKLYN